MSRRNDRVNQLLREEISALLARQIKDPRLGVVITITRVETSNDLRNAKVFFSVMGDADAKQTALAGIESAAAFLRRELHHRLNLRHTPFLSFSLDESVEEGDNLLQLMDGILEPQREQHPAEGSDRYTGPLTFSTGDS